MLAALNSRTIIFLHIRIIKYANFNTGETKNSEDVGLSEVSVEREREKARKRERKREKARKARKGEKKGEKWRETQ